MDCIYTIIREQDLKGLREWIRENNIDQYDSMGKTVLHSLIEHSWLDGVKLMINFGANIDKQDEFWKYTPLIYAIQHNVNFEIIKLLIDCHANLNIQDGSRNTPLMHGAMKNRLDVIEYLVRAGCDLNKKNYLGNDYLGIHCSMHPTALPALKEIFENIIKNFI